MSISFFDIGSSSCGEYNKERGTINLLSWLRCVPFKTMVGTNLTMVTNTIGTMLSRDVYYNYI